MSLLFAAHDSSLTMCRLLLAAGADVEEREPNTKNTPLHYAAIYGQERTIKLLLSHKADVNSRSKTGVTPLYIACSEGHLASVVTLLQAGADPLMSAVDGSQPIHKAAQQNQSDVVRMLVEKTENNIDQVRHITLQHM